MSDKKQQLPKGTQPKQPMQQMTPAEAIAGAQAVLFQVGNTLTQLGDTFVHAQSIIDKQAKEIEKKDAEIEK